MSKSERIKMAIIIAKSRNKSVFDRPGVTDAIKNFNPNNPEFVKALQERNEKTELEFENLKRRERAAEQRMSLSRWIPIRGRD